MVSYFSGGTHVTSGEVPTDMRYLLSLPALALMVRAAAQCPFTPTITPEAPILCPGGTALLSTQAYENYQWYKEGQAIPNATQQTLEVNYFDDAGSSFSVLATSEGCPEMSASVLVDGWVFLPPYVIHQGDPAVATGPNGEAIHCLDAFVELALGQPYTENITWTLDGEPIPGADDPTLVVNAGGSYGVSAAPSVCPASITPLGVTVDIEFLPPSAPVISEMDGQLCTTPDGEIYQWYLNGTAILNSNTPCIPVQEVGAYTVRVYYAYDCQATSDPYLSTGSPDPTAPRLWTLTASPEAVTVTWEGAVAMGTFWSINDEQGRSVRNGFMPRNSPLEVDLAGLSPGVYLFQAAHHNKALAPAQRFTVVK